MSLRYARQEALWGEEGQRTLSEAHVAVIGAGGLGSPALLYLAGAGVGRISLFDDDVVSPSNLHRQVIHTTAAIGTPKTDSAAAAVRALNPEVDITCHGRLESATALKQLRGCDLILDGTDNFDARYLSSWAAHELGIPHVWASILGFDASESVMIGDRRFDMEAAVPNKIPCVGVLYGKTTNKQELIDAGAVFKREERDVDLLPYLQLQPLPHQ